MAGIHLMLLLLALFGFVPLAIILYKRNRVKKILTSGVQAKASVYEVRPMSRSAAEIVYYWFHVPNSTKQYAGSLTIKSGSYKKGDVLDVYYLQSDPRRSTVNGAWASPVIVGFGIAIAAFILFAVYKMYKMVQAGSM